MILKKWPYFFDLGPLGAFLVFQSLNKLGVLRAVHVLLGTFGQMGDFWTIRGLSGQFGGLLDNHSAFWRMRGLLDNFGAFWTMRGTFGQLKSNFFLE